MDNLSTRAFSNNISAAQGAFPEVSPYLKAGQVFTARRQQEDGSEYTIDIHVRAYDGLRGLLVGKIDDDRKQLRRISRRNKIKHYIGEIIDNRDWSFEGRSLSESGDLQTEIWNGLPEFRPLAEKLKNDVAMGASWDLANRDYIFMQLTEERGVQRPNSPVVPFPQVHYACLVRSNGMLMTQYSIHRGPTRLIRFNARYA